MSAGIQKAKASISEFKAYVGQTLGRVKQRVGAAVSAFKDEARDYAMARMPALAAMPMRPMKSYGSIKGNAQAEACTKQVVAGVLGGASSVMGFLCLCFIASGDTKGAVLSGVSAVGFAWLALDLG